MRLRAINHLCEDVLRQEIAKDDGQLYSLSEKQLAPSLLSIQPPVDKRKAGAIAEDWHLFLYSFLPFLSHHIKRLS